MFDIISGSAKRTLNERRPSTLVMSAAVHGVLLLLLVVLPLLYATDRLPEVQTMTAFVAGLSPPPPPPPPPPAPVRAARGPTPVATTGRAAEPVSAPREIRAESRPDVEAPGGVPGGVEGGLPGGVLGGVVGGIPAGPPVLPPPAAPRAPVRVGGMIQAPALIHRVEPIYPAIAAQAKISGIITLEAVVDETGRVGAVRILRSESPLLEESALTAVHQWRYSPLVLNGRPESFVLSVTIRFSVSHP